MDFKINQTAQKLRGGYYTPKDLASFMANWINSNSQQKILEPSCGDGNFLEALQSLLINNPNSELTCVELDEIEIKKSIERANNLKINHQIRFKNADFLSWGLDNLDKVEYDSVIGNPPFIRYQFLPENYQHYAKRVFDLFGLKFTKHTNAWVSFVILSFALLKNGGKMAFILPSEIMHVIHAQSLRTFLGKNSSRLMIIDPKELWFEGTLQGAVILLAEKKEKTDQHSTGLGIKEVSLRKFTEQKPSELFKSVHFINGETIRGKWTKAILDKNELGLMSEMVKAGKFVKFNEIAKVDVGIVTGANKFFLTNDEIVKKYDLKKWSKPMFGRSEHCPSLIYNKKQHQLNKSKGFPTNFLHFNSGDKSDFNEKQRSYIDLGEEDSLNTRYKCRIRNPWFKVPSVYSTLIGMMKRSHHSPRLIYNELNALTTDTAYRISLNENSDIDSISLVYSFINSLTALSSELEGRFYGGGVLELVPSEIENVLIPNFGSYDINQLYELNSLYSRVSINELYKIQDQIILKDAGLLDLEISILQNALLKLRSRRQRSN